MKNKIKFYGKVIFVPIILIIVVLSYWIYSIIFSNPFPKLIPNVHEICAIELIILIAFTIYQIVDYSKVFNEKENIKDKKEKNIINLCKS